MMEFWRAATCVVALVNLWMGSSVTTIYRITRQASSLQSLLALVVATMRVKAELHIPSIFFSVLPLRSSDRSSWLQSGDVLCFM
jgi:hypothetical protein